MSVHNTFARIARNAEKLPPDTRPFELAEAVGKAIPFVETAGVQVEKLAHDHVVATLRNTRAAHNHIGGLHAGAITLLAETVTGLVVAINVREDCVPVIRTAEVNFVRAAEGDLRAEARIGSDEVERIQSSEIGRITVAASVVDAEGQSPIKNSMHWAWLPKRKAMG